MGVEIGIVDPEDDVDVGLCVGVGEEQGFDIELFVSIAIDFGAAGVDDEVDSIKVGFIK